MEGYHGTTPQNAQAIIQTKEVKIKPFSIKSDVVIPTGQRLPNDLGQGLYLFLDNESLEFDGKKCAKQYAQKWKSDRNKTALIQFCFDETTLSILDFNQPENFKRFVKLRDKLYRKIEQSLTTFKETNSLRRANLDGIFIEYLIQHGLKIQVDGVVKDTYTPFYSSRSTLSNFPNGRELCLRNTDAINWEATKEVE
ncbi:TPA: hypothetical protein ACGORV_000022 [Streptococcus suis]